MSENHEEETSGENNREEDLMREDIECALRILRERMMSSLAYSVPICCCEPCRATVPIDCCEPDDHC